MNVRMIRKPNEFNEPNIEISSTMSVADIVEWVIYYVALVAGSTPDRYQNTNRIVTDCAFSPDEVSELLGDLESRFLIEYPDEYFEDCYDTNPSMNGIAQYIQQLLS